MRVDKSCKLDFVLLATVMDIHSHLTNYELRVVKSVQMLLMDVHDSDLSGLFAAIITSQPRLMATRR